ncbi:MAG: hypothetical protein J4G05_03195 [Chlorobi bacterium]|nr:hypothetical protein [Chlorobiota bacterium]
MTYSIPFSVEEQPRLCLIELLDLSQQNVLAEIYRGECQPGTHSIEFDPSTVDGGLEAGVYIIRLHVGEHSESYPFRYMP